MDNSDIENNGLAVVQKYECDAGRTKIRRVSKCGYDLITSRADGSDERHIEVKATEKKVFTTRWLEQLEQDALDTDAKYHLYLVTKAGAAKPKVRVYSADEVKRRFGHTETRYIYKFPKADFLA